MKFITTYSLFFFSLLFFGFSASGQVSADFTASPTSGCTPLLVSFNNTSTGASSYTWQFNNGDGVDHLVDPSTTFLNDTDITLTYTVTLTAYNGTDSSKHSVVITVYPLPKVNFVASDTTVCLGTPITFTSTTIGGVPGPIAYTWNYGDGTGNTGNPVSHTFTAAGNYNITLYATNAEGCQPIPPLTQIYMCWPRRYLLFRWPVVCFADYRQMLNFRDRHPARRLLPTGGHSGTAAALLREAVSRTPTPPVAHTR